jgi:hypothetical protein
LAKAGYLGGPKCNCMGPSARKERGPQDDNAGEMKIVTSFLPLRLW